MKYSIGGTEITEDADVIEVTATATLMCVFDRLQNEDGTPFTNEEMKDVGRDYIEGEHFRMSDMNNVVYTVNSLGKLNKDVAAKLMKALLVKYWEGSLEDAKEGNDEHWMEVCHKELEDIYPAVTYEQVKAVYRDEARRWEDRPEDIFDAMVALFVDEGEDTNETHT